MMPKVPDELAGMICDLSPTTQATVAAWNERRPDPAAPLSEDDRNELRRWLAAAAQGAAQSGDAATAAQIHREAPKLDARVADALAHGVRRLGPFMPAFLLGTGLGAAFLILIAARREWRA